LFEVTFDCLAVVTRVRWKLCQREK